MAIISELKAKTIKPDSTPIPHGGVVGLTLHPSQVNGRGKWVLRYVSPVTKKRRNAGLGSYPEVSIKQVSQLGFDFRSKLEKGIDPLMEKKQLKEKQTAPTFEEAMLSLHKDLLPGWKNEKHGQQWINTLTLYAIPYIKDLPLDAISPKHIADILKPIWIEKAETASRVKQRLHAIFAWGWAHGYCTANPVDVVKHLLPLQESKKSRTQHHPAMPWQNMPQFVCGELLMKNHLSHKVLEVLILTAGRSGEVRGMAWSEINLEERIWIIPAERMKTNIQHRVPLTSRVIEILKQQKGQHPELVFPSPSKAVILSDMTLTSLLRRLKAQSSCGKIATAHGFRSSFRDWCSEHNYSRDLAERALAHQIHSQSEAAYHRTDLLEQRRYLMQEWESYLYGSRV